MKTVKIISKRNKQVRVNVFESNSSSTHSVTIRNKTAPKSPNPTRELVKDNILYPEVLSDYTLSFGYDSSATCCDTKDKKAAIVCNWVYYIVKYNSSFENDNKQETFLSQILQKFVKACGYDGVDVDSMSGSFYPHTEYGEEYLPYEVYEDDAGEFEDAVMKLVKTVLDDDMIIEESDIEN